MKTGPAATLVMRQAEFRLKLVVVLFDAPAHLRSVHQFGDADIGRHIGQPVLRGLGLFERPFDEQPLLVTQLCSQVITMRRAHPHASKARREHFIRTFTPSDSLPLRALQCQGELLHAQRLMARPAPQPFRRAAHTWIRRGWQRRDARRPHRGGRVHAHRIAQAQFVQRLGKAVSRP